MNTPIRLTLKDIIHRLPATELSYVEELMHHGATRMCELAFKDSDEYDAEWLHEAFNYGKQLEKSCSTIRVERKLTAYTNEQI